MINSQVREFIHSICSSTDGKKFKTAMKEEMHTLRCKEVEMMAMTTCVVHIRYLLYCKKGVHIDNQQKQAQNCYVCTMVESCVSSE